MNELIEKGDFTKVKRLLDSKKVANSKTFILRATELNNKKLINIFLEETNYNINDYVEFLIYSYDLSDNIKKDNFLHIKSRYEFFVEKIYNNYKYSQESIYEILTKIANTNKYVEVFHDLLYQFSVFIYTIGTSKDIPNDIFKYVIDNNLNMEYIYMFISYQHIDISYKSNSFLKFYSDRLTIISFSYILNNTKYAESDENETYKLLVDHISNTKYNKFFVSYLFRSTLIERKKLLKILILNAKKLTLEKKLLL